jgi:phage repressor protein C with HTH and peptisase S24 domain
MTKIMDMHPTMERLYKFVEDNFGIVGQTEVATRLNNQSPQTLNNWEARGISKAGILLAAEVFGINSTFLETGKMPVVNPLFSRAAKIKAKYDEEQSDEYVTIREVDFKLSAGITGFSIDYPNEEKAPITFRREWIASRGYDADKMFAVSVTGESMETNLYAGDLVVVNTKETTPVDGSVYAVNYEGELLIKRLVRDNGQWWLSSDNADQRKYPRKQCAGDICLILGKIVHKQSERI